MWKKIGKAAFVGLILVFCAGWFFPSSATGLEGKAGEVIRSENDIKELETKGLIPRSQAASFSELVKAGVSIPIVETTDRTIALSKGYKTATEMYKGTVTLNPEGAMQNYKSGRPFPDVRPDDPKAGIKAAWNWDCKHHPADFWQEFKYWLTDAKGNTKILGGRGEQGWGRLYFGRRTDMDPKPDLIPGNPEGVWYKEITSMSEPFALKGLAQLTVKYIDPSRDNDIWIYVPGLRRTIRIGGGNKCDCLGGFVHNVDDGQIFDGNILSNTYKMLGVQDYLAFALTNPEVPVTKNEKVHLTNFKLERRKVWLVEATVKDPHYCYSKRLWRIDPENFWILHAENYDRAGRMWKEHSLIFANHPSGDGGISMENRGGNVVDHKIWESGSWTIPKFVPNSGLPQSIFTLDYLRRVGR